MTTTTFGAPTHAPTGAPAREPEPEPADGAHARRRLLLMIAVALGVAVVAGAYLLLGPDRSAEPEEFVVPPRAAPAAPTATATAAAPAPSPIRSQPPVQPRNPFVALVVPDAATVAPTTGATRPAPVATAPVRGSVATARPVTPVTPGTPVAQAPVAAAAPRVPAAQTPAARTPAARTPASGLAPSTERTHPTVRMGAVDAQNRSARITVGTTTRLVVPGQSIGGFALVNLHDGTCGAVKHGTTVFDLCEGSSRTFG